MALKTYEVSFDVVSKVTVRVRAVDELRAKSEGMDRLGGVLDMVEGHYSRVKFSKEFTAMAVNMVKDPVADGMAARKARRAADKAAAAPQEPVSPAGDAPAEDNEDADLGRAAEPVQEPQA